MLKFAPGLRKLGYAQARPSDQRQYKLDSAKGTLGQFAFGTS